MLRRAVRRMRPGHVPRSPEPSGSEFFRGLFRWRKFLFHAGLRGGFRLRRGCPLPRFLRSGSLSGWLIFPGLRGRLRSLWFRFGLLLLVFFDEADRLEIREVPEICNDAELRHEPFLVRLADVRQMDFRAAALQIDLELFRETVVHVDDRAYALVRSLRLPRRLHDVLQGLARERVVEVHADATGARRGDDAVLPADRDFESDLGTDFLPQELPLGAQLDEAWVSDSGALFRRNQDLGRLPGLRPDEGGLQAFEQAPAADDDRDLDVDFLLVELALLLRDLIVRRVEEGQGPVRVHRPGVVLNPDDVPFLDLVRDHRLTARRFRKSRTRLNLTGAALGAPDGHRFMPIATEIRLYRFRIVTSVTPATSATSFCVHGLLHRIAEM